MYASLIDILQELIVFLFLLVRENTMSGNLVFNDTFQQMDSEL